MPSRTRLHLLFAMKKTLALILLLAGLTVGAQGRTLTWAPTPGSNSWDTATANWLAEDGNATVFQNGDDVVFSDTGLAVLECELSPTSVLVDTRGNISFQAGFHDHRPGRLAGSMQLIKNGSGTLEIGCDNSYTGGTVLNEGTIMMYNSNAFGTGGITLNGGTLDLQQHDIDSDKVTLKGAATINNGIIVVAEDKTFTLGNRLSGTVGFTLGNNATLNLGQSTIDSDKVTLKGYASINDGILYVGENKTYTLDSRLSGTVSFTLGDNATLDLCKNNLSTFATLQGNAFIGNGSIDHLITVGKNKNLTLLPNTTIFGDIFLEGAATLDLGGNAIDSKKLALQGSDIIGNGKINGNLAMEPGHSLTLLANTTITGGITLGDAAMLNLGHNDTITGGITLGNDAMLNLGQNDTIAGGITLGNNATLNLGQNDTIADGITLGDDARLDLGQNTISGSVTLQGSAFIGNGVLNSDLAVVAGKELWLYSGDLTGSGAISLGNGATLHVGNGGYNMGCGISGCGAIVMDEAKVTTSLTGSMKDFSGSVEVLRGTLNLMNIDDAPKLNVADVTIAANGVLGVYKGETAAEANEGVLTITGGHKLTAGKDARLNADLVMGGGVEATAVLDVSANLGDGGLEMGSTVTLNPGSVLLSDADMDAIGELAFMGKYDLFNGVDGLSLGGDFLSELGLADKWVKAADVFANDLFKSAEREYYLFYSGVNRGGAGGNVGTVYLMQIPEPATGTLSLLALCALAARRRRK